MRSSAASTSRARVLGHWLMRLEGDVQVVATGFVVLEPIGHDSQGQCLDSGDRLIFGGTVGGDPGQLDDFREPTPVVLALSLSLGDDRQLRPPAAAGI